MTHTYYSQRIGVNPNPKGLPLDDILKLFLDLYGQMHQEGYFHEAFGFSCVDLGEVPGKLRDIELEMLLAIRKRKLWPIYRNATFYSEDDFFDVIEFLYQHVSKPVEGSHHSYNDCGMHWETFNQNDGKLEFRYKMNRPGF